MKRVNSDLCMVDVIYDLLNAVFKYQTRDLYRAYEAKISGAKPILFRGICAFWKVVLDIKTWSSKMVNASAVDLN